MRNIKITMKPNWEQNIANGMKKALLEMVVDVHGRAVTLAPVDTSALRNSGQVLPITDGYKVTFGNSRVPYARIRHFENRKNPQTKGYLAKAGDSVARGNISKYFRGKV